MKITNVPVPKKFQVCTVDTLLRSASTKYLAVLKINMVVKCLHLMSRHECCVCLKTFRADH